MSQQDVETVRRAYEAYARGDFAEAGSAYSEDNVCTLREGKIVETVVYRDPQDAFDAAGLPA
jgi:ketosteroid isomerase-like protein